MGTTRQVSELVVSLPSFQEGHKGPNMHLESEHEWFGEPGLSTKEYFWKGPPRLLEDSGTKNWVKDIPLRPGNCSFIRPLGSCSSLQCSMKKSGTPILW